MPKQAKIFGFFQPLQVQTSSNKEHRATSTLRNIGQLDEQESDDEADLDLPLSSLASPPRSAAASTGSSSTSSWVKRSMLQPKTAIVAATTYTTSSTTSTSTSASSRQSKTTSTSAKTISRKRAKLSAAPRQQTQLQTSLQEFVTASTELHRRTTTTSSTETSRSRSSKSSDNSTIRAQSELIDLSGPSGGTQSQSTPRAASNASNATNSPSMTDSSPTTSAVGSVCVTPCSESESRRKIKQVKTYSLRRIFSHSSMEFIAPTTTAPTHFLLRLQDRATSGSVRPLRSPPPASTSTSTSTPPRDQGRRPALLHRPPNKWKSPKWVHVDTTVTGRAAAAMGASSVKVEHLAWDPMGVLLAVGLSNRRVRIYDWDMVRAADVGGKCQWQRRQWTTKNTTSRLAAKEALSLSLSIPPILDFGVPHAISKLRWNPSMPDELAVGFKVTGACHLYQLDRVSAWLVKQQEMQRRSHNSWNEAAQRRSLYPPPRTYIDLLPQRRSQHTSTTSHNCGTVQSIVYLDPRHVLVSLGHMVYCWKLLVSDDTSSDSTSTSATKGSNPQQLSSPLLKWRYQPSSSCTCASPLPRSSWVLLGTEGLQMCLLDWTQTTKERAFSSEFQPKLIHQWTPKDNEKRNLEAGGMVDVKIASPLVLDPSGEVSSRKATPSSPLHFGRLDITWVTSCGWLLTTSLECPKPMARSNGNRKSSKGTMPFFTSAFKVLQAPPKVEYRNADGDVISSSTNPRATSSSALQKYSLPMNPVTADLSTPWQVWPEIPGMTKYLGHSDKYVLDGQPKTVRSQDRSLLVRVTGHRNSSSSIHKIPLPRNQSAPQVMALHPGLEWLVLGVESRLVLLVGRG